jgi:SWI/SNF-related matrix-associated actin-dependent regulator of chromatin subfamily A3
MLPEEKELYKDLLDNCRREIDKIVGGRSELKKYSVLFTSIMRMRRICNHGAFLAVREQLLGSVTAELPDAEESLFCELCKGSNKDDLALLSGSDFCPDCNRSLSTPSVPSAPSLGTTASRSPPATLSDTDGGPEALHSAVPFGRPIGRTPRFLGISSKLLAVVDNVEKWKNKSKRYVIQRVIISWKTLTET